MLSGHVNSLPPDMSRTWPHRQLTWKKFIWPAVDVIKPPPFEPSLSIGWIQATRLQQQSPESIGRAFTAITLAMCRFWPAQWMKT